MKKTAIPMPYKIPLGTSDLYYKCPKCGCDLRVLGNVQKYCFQCGIKLDWSHCPESVSKEFREEYEQYFQKFMNNQLSYQEMYAAEQWLLRHLYAEILKKNT